MILGLKIAGVAVLAAALVVWIRRCFLLYTERGRGPVLSAETASAPGDVGLVSVIVPAKDEEGNIGEALATLRAQDYPNLEIIVVDDRSDDRTGEIVREVAAEDERVRFVRVDELPEGWFGKPHAMHVGAGAARGRWLLFVDADCRQAPHSVRAGVGLAEQRGAEMLSLWPVIEMHGFWENAVQPVAGSVLVAWFQPNRVNDPDDPRAFANGQYVLIRRHTYEATGGYEAVRNELVEDIAIARHVKGEGHRLLNAVGLDLFSTRMYSGLADMWHGWTRIYAGGFKRPGRLAGVMLATSLLALAPFVVTAAGAAVLVAGAHGWFTVTATALAGAVAAGAIAGMRKVFQIGSGNPWYLAFYPMAVAVTIGFELSAFVRTLGVGHVTWRGTAYKSGRVIDEG